MFQILPVYDREHLAVLFDGQALALTPDSFAMELIIDGEESGLCLFRLEDEVKLLALSYPADDIALADALIRSALNFALNRGVEIADFEEIAKNEAVIRFGFIKNSLNFKINSANLFKECQNCNK